MMIKCHYFRLLSKKLPAYNYTLNHMKICNLKNCYTIKSTLIGPTNNLKIQFYTPVLCLQEPCLAINKKQKRHNFLQHNINQIILLKTFLSKTKYEDPPNVEDSVELPGPDGLSVSRIPELLPEQEKRSKDNINLNYVSIIEVACLILFKILCYPVYLLDYTQLSIIC